MEADFGQPGNIARVRATSPDRRRLFLALPTGQVATVDLSEPSDLEPGTVVSFRVDDGHFEVVPGDVWPEESWLGVVRLRLDDVTVVDGGGRLVKVPTNPSVEYSLGNTVEVKDASGVLRVLAEEPIRMLDLPGLGDEAVRAFLTNSEDLSTSFDDFGGMRDVVARARELIEVPLRHHAALATIGARPIKGVLFTGPPGTGKTMLARIIAGNAGAAFYEISGPEIFSKWYGQSEELLRRIFAHAARQERAIVFFDEIDSVASQRSDDAHEASRRVVAQLLTLMDGFSPDSNVVVVATTNRPQDIDVALRRPGRFDWEVTFGLPTRSDREHILVVTAQKLATAELLPHGLIADKTESWSAAELAAIWSEAALLAVSDRRDLIMTEDYFGGYERVAAQRRRAGGNLLAPLITNEQ